jgi:hypothetical protein
MAANKSALAVGGRLLIMVEEVPGWELVAYPLCSFPERTFPDRLDLPAVLLSQ